MTRHMCHEEESTNSLNKNSIVLYLVLFLQFLLFHHLHGQVEVFTELTNLEEKGLIEISSEKTLSETILKSNTYVFAPSFQDVTISVEEYKRGNSALIKCLVFGLLNNSYRRSYWRRYNIEAKKNLVRKYGMTRFGYSLPEIVRNQYLDSLKQGFPECPFFKTCEGVVDSINDIRYIFNASYSSTSGFGSNLSGTFDNLIDVPESVSTVAVDPRKFMLELREYEIISEYAYQETIEIFKGEYIPKFAIFKKLSEHYLLMGDSSNVFANRRLLVNKLRSDSILSVQSFGLDDNSISNDNFHYDLLKALSVSHFIGIGKKQSLQSVLDSMVEYLIHEEVLPDGTQVKRTTGKDRPVTLELYPAIKHSGKEPAVSISLKVKNPACLNFHEFNSGVFNGVSLVNKYLLSINSDVTLCACLNYRLDGDSYKFKEVGMIIDTNNKSLFGKYFTRFMPNIICGL